VSDLPVAFNDLSRGYREMRTELQQAVNRVLEGGVYVLGDEVAAFEREFADFLGLPHCVGVGNGTDGLELAMVVLGAEPGAEIVLAANAGGYASVAAAKLGLRLRYADVSQQTLLLTAETIAPHLNSRTAAVVVTHLYGRLADMDPIMTLCRTAGIPVIEDCAQSVGAASSGRRAGSFGDVGAFSFYPTKNLGALGDAGAVVVSSPELHEKLLSLRQYGWTDRGVIGVEHGRNSRLDEIQAAVLRVRLGSVDDWNERRRSIARRYLNAIGDSFWTPMEGIDESYVAHLAVVGPVDRRRFLDHFDERQIGTGIHYAVPDHRQEALVPYACEATHRLEVTEDASGRVVSLPCFPQLTDSEVERVCEALSTFSE